MATPPVRTNDQTIRALQWARMRDLTTEQISAMALVQALRHSIAALKTAHQWEWQFSDIDTEVLRTLKNRITSRVDALKLATDGLSAIQSELYDLQTALDDNYEVSDGLSTLP